MREHLACVFFSIVGSAGLAVAQTPPAPAPEQPPAAAPAPAPWTMGDIKINGMIDAYYSHNFNNPASGFNTLRNFEVKSRQFSLNMAELSLSRDAEPIGFRLDLGFGRAFDILHATEPGGRDVQRFIPQAFVSLKPKSWGGTQIDFGKFYTSAGAELTENIYTWSYGRGYIYTLGPYYHMGLRVTKPLSKTFTAGFQVVNGWNNVEDNNSGKTIGLTTAWTGKKIAWNNNYYFGPEKNSTNVGFRNFFDTVVTLTPNDNFSAYINYDHGTESQANGNKTPNANWDIIALAGKFQLNPANALSFRYEYVSDKDGFATGYGSKINLQEITATYEYKWMKGLLTRLEYRHDWSNKGFFEYGNQGQPLNPGIGTFTPGPKKHQDTLTIGFVAFFGPK